MKGIKVFSAFGLILLSANALTVSCASWPSRAKSSADLETKRVKLEKIQPGMAETDVRRQLGKPDEVRIAKHSYFENEGYRWAYAGLRKGGFANIGIVVFATNHTVILARSPTECTHDISDPPNFEMLDVPQTTSTGQYCLIE